MRIVAGDLKGRTLATPKDSSVIRPTADRARETIFNVLGQAFDGETVLDLFAGTGAMALEALSRGASRAVLVDSGREARILCERNVGALGLADRVRFLGLPVERALPALAREGAAFELVFADPPYRVRAIVPVLEALDRLGLVSPGGWVVTEHDEDEVPGPRVGALHEVDRRTLGRTVITSYRRAAPADVEPRS